MEETEWTDVSSLNTGVDGALVVVVAASVIGALVGTATNTGGGLGRR